MKLVLILLLALTQFTNQTNDSKITISDFKELCEYLPKIDLPYSIYCENCCKHPSLDEKQSLIKSYLPDGSSFMGIIEINEDFVSILATYPADWIIPAVMVFNSAGELLDKEVFLGGYCGSDYGYFGKQYLSINEQMEITEIDTNYYLNYHQDTFDVKDTSKIEIKFKTTQTNKNGIIREK